MKYLQTKTRHQIFNFQYLELSKHLAKNNLNGVPKCQMSKLECTDNVDKHKRSISRHTKTNYEHFKHKVIS